jgi:hypothetical protein
MTMRKLLAVSLLLALAGCGDKVTGPPPPPPPPPPPSATITATGSGALVIHPSANPTFSIAMETPIRITETAGGSADWGFARMSIFLRGAEVERLELNANDIRAAGFGRIAASSNTVYTLLFRFNSDDFDRIDITLGFSDVKDGRQFTVAVPSNSFTGVNIGLNPLSLRHATDPL